MLLNTLDLPDQQEEVRQIEDELPEGVEVEELCHGLKMWTNPINGFTVLRLHYTADPAKRSPEWKAEERRKYGEAEWNREMEIMWESLDGRPVFADHWKAEFHTAKTSMGWNPKYPICRGWDFGLYGACLFAQLFPHSRLFILREAVSQDISFERFLEEVGRLSLEWFPGARFVEFVDPTGRFRMGADERTYTRMLTAKPIMAKHIISGANDKVARKKGVTDFLGQHVKGLPSYIVDKSCDTLIKGFNGGYFYKFKNNGTLNPDPEKNFYSHIHDANQYLCSKVLSVKLDQVIIPGKIKEPRYGGREPNAYANA